MTVKARYIFIICVISLIINVVSVYNLMLGFVSLLLMLITFVTAFFTKIVKKASNVEESERSFATRQIANYGSQGITRIMNRIAVIIGLIVLYSMTVGTMLYQLNNWDNLSQFISNKVHIAQMIGYSDTLSKVGWGILVLALILVTIHMIRLMKTSPVFTKSAK